MRFCQLDPQRVIMEAPVISSVILNTESNRENSVIEKNECIQQEHLLSPLENENGVIFSCSPERNSNHPEEEDDSETLEACAAAATLEACRATEDVDQCKSVVPQGYVTESSIIVRNESVIFTKSNEIPCNIILSAKNPIQSGIIRSPHHLERMEDVSKQMCTGMEEEDMSSDTDDLSQDNLNDYSQEIKLAISKVDDHIMMRSAPVICMAPSLSHSGYGLPGCQGLPPVSTIIRSTARFEKSLSSLANAHLAHLDHHSNVSLPQMIEMNVMHPISSNALTPSDLSVVYAAQRSVVVSAPSDMNMDMSSVILNLNMSQQETQRMLQASKDSSPDMDHMENNGHHIDTIRYHHPDDMLHDAKYIYDSYDLNDSVHSDMNDHDMGDGHHMLSVAEAKNLIVASETRHFSSDEGSSESSPLLTVDSDMEVQDLTHRINHNSDVSVKPMHGMPTGVITSSIRNLEMVDLPRSSAIQKIIDEGEAEDLSNRVKIRMDIGKNSDSGSPTGISVNPSLQGIGHSVLPSFLSSLTSSSLASLSASLTGMPMSGIPTTCSSLIQPGLMSNSASVLFSSILPNSSSGILSSVKPEPRGNSSESSQCSSPDTSPIATTSTSVYATLPSLSTFTSLIKQEMSNPSCGPLPPFPVISGLTALKRSESTNVSSSYATSSTQLPPYSSMRIPQSVTIPTSPSSDSPTSSPVGVPSDSLKKNEQFKEVSSSSLSSKNEGKDSKWCCMMCRNGSPCGLHPKQAQVSTSATVSNVGPLPSGDPAKPYQCNLCGKNLASKNVYQLHMRSHSGEKPFRCNLCGHNFSQKTSLTRHMRSHTGERPFPCGVCGKRFADKERIKIHMRTHTGEKPFACEVCGKRFSQKSTVKRHMSVHTGEKPFKCDLCGKGFANRGNLNAHAKTHANS